MIRKTPISFLHRLLWYHVPNAFGAVDERLTGRRVSRSLARTGNYLMNEKHPLVLVWHKSASSGHGHGSLTVSDLLRGPTIRRRSPLHPRRLVSPLIPTTSDLTTPNHRAPLVPLPQQHHLLEHNTAEPPRRNARLPLRLRALPPRLLLLHLPARQARALKALQYLPCVRAEAGPPLHLDQ